MTTPPTVDARPSPRTSSSAAHDEVLPTGGDVITFIEKPDHGGFRTALERLATL